MSLSEISTTELVAELQKRKSTELPVMIEQVNKSLEVIKALAGEIVYNQDDSFILDKIEYDAVEERVIYSDIEQ